ncbi:MAG: tRNA (adenosine(37)-N6)-threonylcarbamoyltransferase complex transferase subunit TsaD [Ruminococcaceae bacterium]|nr:tRNA (adenosine(37)-N6)-threonylcarbamoyltransferase complex transferase subunit TsaD [Oscillospiraceae bacterium]
MKIIAIESSCDETAVAIVENGRRVLSNAILSQADMHALYGGVVPEIASRKHIECIAALTEKAFLDAGVEKEEIDAVAVTFAPGLIGALLVGVGFAKALAFALEKPLIPVHHIRGHIAANYIAFPELEPPFLCLVASGGHTLLVDVKDYTKFEIMGSTRDDAAGEAFDKCARVLGIGYPGGAKIDALAKEGDKDKYKLPRANIDGFELDMSFSGLKTAVINLVHRAEQKGEEIDKAGLAASFTEAVCDAIVPRTIAAAKLSGRKKIAIAGGVAANSFLRERLQNEAKSSGIELFFPPLSLCGDNGAMIAAQGYFEFLQGNEAKSDLNACATLPIDFES